MFRLQTNPPDVNVAGLWIAAAKLPL